MSTKHTPGPWRRVDCYIYGGPPGTGSHVADASPFGPMADAGVADANARLIAAAPDLLAALEALMHTTEDDLHYLDVCQRARAAIRKARGES